VPAGSSSQAPDLIRHLAGCHLTAPRQAVTPLDRLGLQHARAGLLCPLLTSARWSARIPPRSVRLAGEQQADLPGYDPERSARRGRISKAHPARGWRTSWSRAHSSRVHHTSYPVPVRRPALSAGASFRRPLAMTPLPCSSPSAPLIPGTGTSTPLALCHAWHTRTKLSGALSSASAAAGGWTARTVDVRT
jgi:hypothetical protein